MADYFIYNLLMDLIIRILKKSFNIIVRVAKVIIKFFTKD